MQDVHGQYTGKLYGQDRIGHITPDLEASDSYRPWLPCAYPAPYLPGLRQDQGHPKAATKVLSSQMVVGLDKSGALVPAGLRSGATGNGGPWCILHYAAGSIDEFAINPKTGEVAAANDYVVLACPTDAVAGNVTLPDGTVIAVSDADIAWAKACDLFPTGVARPIGLATRDVYQYIGGVKVKSTAKGILYQLDPMNPLGFPVMNYTHEMGTAIQTDYVVRVPLIGASRTALKTLATADGIVGYKQGYGLSFTHFTGSPKNGDLVVASQDLQDAGNFTQYDPAKHALSDVCGRILGVINMVDKIGFMARVKTLWDPQRMVGPYKDPNTASIMMGGSATGGIPYDISLTTDGLFKLYKTQKKDVAGKPELGTYVLIRVNL